MTDKRLNRMKGELEFQCPRDLCEGMEERGRIAFTSKHREWVIESENMQNWRCPECKEKNPPNVTIKFDDVLVDTDTFEYRP